MAKINRKCAECIYWEPMGGAFGECRVNPPIIIVNKEKLNENVGSWPTTQKKDWCGRYS
jgi:hypothetical protein